MNAVEVPHVVVVSEQIADGAEVAAGIGARAGDGRGRTHGRAAANYHRADGIAGDPPGQIDRRLAGEEVTAAREAHARRIEQARGEDVLFLDAGHLLAQALEYRAQRIGGGRVGEAVVYRIDPEQGIVL